MARRLLAAKPGPKARSAYSNAEFARAARGLRVSLEFAGDDPSRWPPPLVAAVAAYAENSKPRRDVTWVLVVLSTQLAQGKANLDLHRVLLSYLGIPVPTMTPLLKSTIARKHPTLLGKAYAIFKIIAKGVDCSPTFTSRKSPTGDLLMLFKAALE